MHEELLETGDRRTKRLEFKCHNQAQSDKQPLSHSYKGNVQRQSLQSD